MVTQLINDLQDVLSLTALTSSCKLKVVTSCIKSIHLMLGLLCFLQLSTFPSITVLTVSYSQAQGELRLDLN